MKAFEEWKKSQEGSRWLKQWEDGYPLTEEDMADIFKSIMLRAAEIVEKQASNFGIDDPFDSGYRECAYYTAAKLRKEANDE